MKHNDEVLIAVPPDVDLTITERNLDYVAKFRLDDGQEQGKNTMTFSISDDATLEVTNTFDVILPTGVMNNIILPLLSAMTIAAFMVVFILWRKKVSPGQEILRRR